MIAHDLVFKINGDKYHYDAKAIQATKNGNNIRLDEFTKAYNRYQLKEAFQALMGVNGDPYIVEILEHGMLSLRSYQAICENIKYNSKDSIVKYFGVVQYYYNKSLNDSY